MAKSVGVVEWCMERMGVAGKHESGQDGGFAIDPDLGLMKLMVAAVRHDNPDVFFWLKTHTCRHGVLALDTENFAKNRPRIALSPNEFADFRATCFIAEMRNAMRLIPKNSSITKWFEGLRFVRTHPKTSSDVVLV